MSKKLLSTGIATGLALSIGASSASGNGVSPEANRVAAAGRFESCAVNSVADQRFNFGYMGTTADDVEINITTNQNPNAFAATQYAATLAIEQVSETVTANGQATSYDQAPVTIDQSGAASFSLYADDKLPVGAIIKFTLNEIVAGQSASGVLEDINGQTLCGGEAVLGDVGGQPTWEFGQAPGGREETSIFYDTLQRGYAQQPMSQQAEQAMQREIS